MRQNNATYNFLKDQDIPSDLMNLESKIVDDLHYEYFEIVLPRSFQI